MATLTLLEVICEVAYLPQKSTQRLSSLGTFFFYFKLPKGKKNPRTEWMGLVNLTCFFMVNKINNGLLAVSGGFFFYLLYSIEKGRKTYIQHEDGSKPCKSKKARLSDGSLDKIEYVFMMYITIAFTSVS